MHITVRSVNEAMLELVPLMHTPALTIRTPSRYGECIQIEQPMLITYTHPRERTLINPYRDANPFFHLYESLWMLAGRQDVDPLALYVKRMKTFSDDGDTLHDAYGYRWRQFFNYDQLDTVCDILYKEPTSRRAVLQMWSSQDLQRVESMPECKAVPCNLSAVFTNVGGQLDMTVVNRSNDLVWGMLGANVVHFSFLHEYVAHFSGLPMGHYHQFSSNLHAYTDNFPSEELLREQKRSPYLQPPELNLEVDRYLPTEVEPHPLISFADPHTPDRQKDKQLFDDEVRDFVRRFQYPTVLLPEDGFRTHFLHQVAQPMLLAWREYKYNKNFQKASAMLSLVNDIGWRTAGQQWLHKRRPINTEN